MSLRERVRSLGIWKLLFLVFFAGLGVLYACGLVVHLGTGASTLVDPDRIGQGLVLEGCQLILALTVFILLLILLVVAQRRQAPVAASFLQQNRVFGWSFAALLLSLILIHACQLIAPLSLPIAWQIETAALVLGVLAPALMLLAVWRREAWWQGK